MVPPPREEIASLVKEILEQLEEDKLVKVNKNAKVKPIYPAVKPNIENFTFLTSEWEWKPERTIKIASQTLTSYLQEKYKKKMGSHSSATKKI